MTTLGYELPTCGLCVRSDLFLDHGILQNFYCVPCLSCVTSHVVLTALEGGSVTTPLYR